MSKPNQRVRPDYLRAIDPDVDAVFRMIAHDLVATRAMNGTDAEVLAMGRGVDFVEAIVGVVDAAATALWIAEAVQEDVIEGYGDLPPMITWPKCPDHPAHPLWLKQRGEDDPAIDQADWDDPAWTCTRTGFVVAELGGL